MSRSIKMNMSQLVSVLDILNDGIENSDHIIEISLQQTINFISDVVCLDYHSNDVYAFIDDFIKKLEDEVK